ncbi:MAG: DUF1579 family protein, partial [Armatimonadota bacterium]
MISIFLPAVLAMTQAQPVVHEFDFWVGDWDIKTETRPDPRKEEWTNNTGKNHVEKILGSEVVQENFTGPNLVGKSWSAYDSVAKVWRQTWVDNQGGYISLDGKFENGVMTLYTTPNMSGRKYRMVYQDIQTDSFLWKWEVQMKDGKWAPMFICHYTR